MKLKCTNVLVIIAMICSVLAMIMNWIIYFGPQDKYVQFFGVDVNTERILDIRSIICPILTVGLYILACTITRKSQKKRTGLAISIVVLVSHIKCCMGGCSKPEIFFLLWGIRAGESFDSE